MPFGSAVGVLAHDLLLLGVDADHRLARLHEAAHLFVQVDELGVSVGVGLSLLFLGRSLERVADGSEYPPDGVVGDLEPLAHQLGGQVARRLGRPAQIRHRVAPGFWIHQLVKGLEQTGLLVLGLDVAPARCSLALCGLNALAHLAFGFDHRVAAHARSLGHLAVATASETLGHGTGHHAALQLVQMGQDHLEELRELIPAGLHQATYIAYANIGGP